MTIVEANVNRPGRMAHGELDRLAEIDQRRAGSDEADAL
jgi:hypothetical protein